MTKTAAKQAKPQTVEIWTRNEHTYYTELQDYILNGYEVILDGWLSPSNIGGVMNCHLRLNKSQQGQD